MSKDYEEFVFLFQATLYAVLPEDVRSHGFRVVNKDTPHGIIHGIMLDTPEGGAVLGLESLYEDYGNGKSLEELAREGAEILMMKHPDGIPTGDELLSLDRIRDRLGIRMVDTNMYGSVLADKAYVSGKSGLAALPYIVCRNHKGGYMATAVTKDLLNAYGCSAMELLTEAMNVCRNSPDKKPRIESLFNTMQNMPGSVARNAPPENDTLVINNVAGFFGASAIIFPEVQKQILNAFNEKAFIIPSSVHEVLAMRYDEDQVEALREIVRNVNQTTVAPNDRLSDEVYVLTEDGLDVAR